MQKKILRRLLTVVTVAIFSASSLAGNTLTYMPRMDKSLWITRSHVLSCKLIQPIPSFGRAIFENAAGRGLHFYLETVSNPLAEGQAELSIEAPTWHPSLPPTNLGLIAVRTGDFPVELETRLSTQLLAELYQGKSPQFFRRAWYAEEQPVRIGLSPATFRAAYGEYRQCLARLASVGFDQLQRSKVYFASDEWSLDEKSRGWLDIIGHYLLHADDVEQLFIDGHTDSTHSTGYNIELSRKRAQAVEKYLIAKGVSANQITTRFHGERYPIESNRTATGKQANRRVTLRVQLVGETVAQR